MDTIDKVVRNDRKNKKEKKDKSTKSIKIKNFFSVMFLLGSLGIFAGLTLLYGPWNGFRDWLITSAMTTMSHQYLATWFYDDDIIKNVMNNNRVYEIKESTNLDLIQIAADVDMEVPTTFANEYEEQILNRDKNNNDYKIVEIEGDGYDGYVVAIYNPARIITVATKYLGSSGQYLTKMAEDNDAVLAINAGGFDDANWEGTGGSPLGVTISEGDIVSDRLYTGTGGLIGFTNDNKLLCTRCDSAEEAINMGVRDAVTFGPYLIVNGERAKVSGNGGWGTAPRSAIGQRQDGVVLFVVINGRTPTRPGATMNELIDIMERYGAYNACNLDGGTSSALVVGNTIVNDPIDSQGYHRTRPVSTGFMLVRDSSDDGDKTVVQNKLEN